MRPVSAAFLDAVTRSHTFAVRVDVLEARALAIEAVPVAGGTVTLDRTAEIRGRCSVKLAAETPTSAFDALTPFGAELQIFSGVQLSTGPELVSLGIFGIQDIKADDKGGETQIEGLDRAQLVKDADFESTYVVAAGLDYGGAIEGLIADGVPGLTYKFASTDALTPLLVFADDTAGGRWAAAVSMATAVGCDLYFDADGACVLEPVPDPRSDPAVDLKDGEGGVVVSAEKAWSRTPAFNTVIAISATPDPGVAPVRAVARDLDPTSPTYYYGPFGRKPKRYPGPFTTAGQAQTAADAMLRQTLGIAQTIDLTVAPNHALEPGDVAAVRRITVGVDEVDVIDSVTYDLTVGTMSLGVRARQVTQ